MNDANALRMPLSKIELIFTSYFSVHGFAGRRCKGEKPMTFFARCSSMRAFRDRALARFQARTVCTCSRAATLRSLDRVCGRHRRTPARG